MCRRAEAGAGSPRLGRRLGPAIRVAVWCQRTTASCVLAGMKFFVALVPFALACASTLEQDSTSRIGIVTAFRAARARGDTTAAEAFLGENPRIWYGEREGDGAPWKLDAGRWKAWDTHFNGVAELVGSWHEEPDRIWGEFFETNDYYELLERGGGYWRGTYFFDDENRIVGFMVSAAEGREKPAGRRKEFEAWAFAEHPAEAEYLMPGGSLDPTGDRAPRMRALIMKWREARDPR